MLLKSMLNVILLGTFVDVCRAKGELIVAKQQHNDHVRQMSEDHVTHQLQIQSLTESCEELRSQLVTRQQEMEKYDEICNIIFYTSLLFTLA